MADLKGVNLAMQTPFDADGGIDYAVFEELIETYVGAGVHGLVLGSGDRPASLPDRGRVQPALRDGARRIAGRCTLICQTSALNMDEIVRRSRHAEAVGADALMILPPYLEGPSDDDGILGFYRDIDAAVGIDIVGYNIPQSTGLAISPELFRRLCELRNFAWIKDSAGDMTVHQQYLQTGGNVLNGCDTTTLYALMAGAPGVIWGAANYMPHEAVRLYELVSMAHYAEALALWDRMLPSLLFIWTNPYNASVLRAAELRGFGTGNLRRPLARLTAEREAALRVALEPLLEEVAA